MKFPLRLLIAASIFSQLWGCAVIDFLDGKHITAAPDREPYRYGGTAGAGRGGGHSH